jgi:hypothetical protein
MNWGRGFFRAWLVISAFWVGLAIYFEGPDTYNMHWLWRGPKIAYTTPSGFSGEFPLSRDRAALTKAAGQALQDEANRLRTTDPQAADERLRLLPSERDGWVNSLLTDYDQMMQPTRDAWLITLIPPSALLVMGVFLGWIFAGFQAKRPV